VLELEHLAGLSSIISSHWAIQPLVRGIAKSTVNMPTGMCSAS
jgi:hypothetical protein